MIKGFLFYSYRQSGCFPTANLQTPPPSEVAISTQKMRNVLKKIIGVKFHITSYLVWAPQAPKHAQMAPRFLQK